MSARSEAAAAGSRTYYTGKPCKRGHVADRYVSDSSCIECALLRATERYQNNADEIRKYSRDRYWSDPENFRDYQAKRREEIPGKVREEKSAEYFRNKEKYLKRANAWHSSNPDKARKAGRDWHKRHPEKSYQYVVKRRMAKLKRTPRWLTTEQRDQIAALYRKARELTRQTGVAHHIDHEVPLRGKEVSGLHVPWNLQILTASQNQSKGNRLAA